MSVVAGLPRVIDTNPSAAEQRFGEYRRAINLQQERGDKACASYYLANLALEELTVRVNKGEEPTEDSIEDIQYRFDISADPSLGGDKLLELRARLMRAWIRPIVWSGVIMSFEDLTKSQIRRAGQKIQLDNAANMTAEIAADALAQFDQIKAIPREQLDEKQHRDKKYLNGFLNETTPILLGARHTTARHFALPSTAYDDDINPNISMHIDGFYYDNRRSRKGRPRFAYQVTSSRRHPYLSAGIPEIDAREMGNLEKSSRWPQDDRSFSTLRRLITERRGKRLSRESASNLDRISSAIFNKITTHQTK